jgi:selenocysteine-specific elongation factor
VSRLPGLHDSDPLRRSAAALYFNGLRPWREEDLVRLAGIDDPRRVMGQLKDEGLLVELTVSPTRSLLVHRDVLDEVFARIESALTQAHDAMPLAVAFPRSRIMRRLEYLGDAALRRALLEALGRTGRIQLTEAGMSLEGRGPKLSKNEQQLLEALLERFQEAGFQPPTAEEITAAATTNRDVVPLLLQLAAAQERLVEIASGVYLSAEHEVQLRQMLVPRLRDEGGLTVSQIRDLLGTTRKFAVPICGYLDRIGFTRREGDLRVLADPAAS